MDRLSAAAAVAAAVGCGLLAGLFVAFSVCVMTGLGRLPAAQGIAAMQALNRAILNPVFFLVFFGTTASCLLAVVAAPFADGPGVPWRPVGALLFLGGAFGVTVVRNVPLNDALDRVDPASPDGAARWERYRSAWTGWNHVRAVAATGAATILVLTLG